MSNFVEWYLRGFRSLVSVVPPDAALTPNSTLDPAQRGKAPGVQVTGGLWRGYDWRRYAPDVDAVRAWHQTGANLGLSTRAFPAVDIDSADPAFVAGVRRLALATLGAAPERSGRPPKTLLLYRTDTPMTRARLWATAPDKSEHLIEVLGDGQQCVVAGVHPVTRGQYTWSDPLGLLDDPKLLQPVAPDDVERFLLAAEAWAQGLGWTTYREGAAREATAALKVSTDLVAPGGVPAVRACVALIPNDNRTAPTRADYLNMAYAIVAASGDDDGFPVFAEWAAKWGGNARFPDGNPPDTVLADYRRCKPPYRMGWGWLQERARPFGWTGEMDEFPVDEGTPAGAAAEDAPLRPDNIPPPLPGTELWLSDLITRRHAPRLRFIVEAKRWAAWDGVRWQMDATHVAEALIQDELIVEAAAWMQRGATDDTTKEQALHAKAMLTAKRVANVRVIMQSNRALALSATAFDTDPWALNTPGGIVQLASGSTTPPDSDALCSRVAGAVSDPFTGCPRWLDFLRDATGQDEKMVAYLHRLAGYCLTGTTREHVVAFLWGPGGNGKSVFLNTLAGILGDYAAVAPLGMFATTSGERHPTELAMLRGARLVVASETNAGQAWDESRLKSLSGGDHVSARFMHGNHFTYRPTFKLLFAGNHRPDIRNVDAAMRRRLHIIPFTHKPTRPDGELEDKLRAEWPGILAWMVAGCALWRAQGLQPPPSVMEHTDDYFADQDSVGTWLETATVADPDAFTSTTDLFASWRVYAERQHEFIGTPRRLSGALESRGMPRKRGTAGARGFAGLRLKDAPTDAAVEMADLL